MHLSLQLRTLADIIDDAGRLGYAAPQTVHAMTWSRPNLIMEDFGEVEAWASYLEVETETFFTDDGKTEHISAEADLSDPYGLAVKVTTNRPVKSEVEV